VALHYGSSLADATQTVSSLAGEGHALIGGDIGEPEIASRVAQEAIERLGTIDILVNNAGAAPSTENTHRIDEVGYRDWVTVWHTMISVNLLGAANISWAIARHLIDRDCPGSIVNVGSRGAHRGEPDYPAYGASKAALQAFGQSIAVALAPHRISVTSVAPGFVATDRQLAKLSGAEGDNLRAQSPFGRVASPEEIAAAIVHLASPEAAWSSGAILDLNGASYLR
jgi:NAD(P)-dependent dehydrogenase (short-subunit alcohol dehydrogenase family)